MHLFRVQVKENTKTGSLIAIECLRLVSDHVCCSQAIDWQVVTGHIHPWSKEPGGPLPLALFPRLGIWSSHRCKWRACTRACQPSDPEDNSLWWSSCCKTWRLCEKNADVYPHYYGINIRILHVWMSTDLHIHIIPLASAIYGINVIKYSLHTHYTKKGDITQ